MKGVIIFVFLLISINGFSQIDINIDGSGSNCLEYYASFLDINTNARISGFGEVGVVTSPFYLNTGLYQNPALISKNNKSAGIDFTYKPWLRNFANDINLASLAGYFSFDSTNAIAFNFTYFDLGSIWYTDDLGIPLEDVNPYEMYFKLGYNHSFNKSISTGIAVKYFRSDLGPNSNPKANSVNSIAFDIGINYDKKYKLNNTSYLNTSAGLAITNLGPKISYTEYSKNFIPTKLALGLFINPDINLNGKFRLNIELAYQAEKYLVPTPPEYNDAGEIVHGYDPNISSLKALYQSFYDAPDGFSEEIDEIKHKFGSELRLNYTNKFYIAFRHGRQLESKNKGNRNFQTFGYGIGFYKFTLDFMNIKTPDNPGLNKNWAISFGMNINL